MSSSRAPGEMRLGIDPYPGRASFPELTVEENLQVGRKCENRADRSDTIGIHVCSAIGRRRAQDEGRLSGGEQQCSCRASAGSGRAAL